tara:strand:- start:1152 stop:2192 length:1041 start_codon:yes stop_codon:yes gene_type:complete
MSTFVRLSSDDIVINSEKISTSTWSNNVNNLTTAHTSSTEASFSSPTASGQFYINVFNVQTDSTSTTPEVQYALAYGHKQGSGSLDFTNDTGSFGFSATRANYGQYRSLIYGDETRDFKFDQFTSDDIYILNVNRARYKQSLKPGSLNLKIKNGSSEVFLTDDSVTTTGSAVLTNLGRQFNIVSGSNGVMVGSTLTQVTDSGSYGLFYPDAGVIILNPACLDATGADGGIGLGTSTNSNTSDKNNQKLYNAISASGYFIVDSEETISSQFYFVRAKNKEFNYTTNASFIDNNGNISFDSMIDNPKSYITTVGLYNDSNELLAVAKLSQPVTKDFTKEALIKVKLDY